MAAIVSLLNQKGGVGKTTVTLGLASAAAVAGHRVLVVDLDPQGSSTWALGTDPAAVDLSAAELFGKSAPTSAIVRTDWSPLTELLPASPRLQGRESSGSPARLRAALHDVADDYDAVLIDCPPSLGNLTTSALVAADHAVIVVEPSALGLRGIGAVADVIDDVWDGANEHLQLAGVILNRVPAVSAEAERRIDELARLVGRKSIWQPPIPQRVIINQAIGERCPIHGYGARSADVTAVFDALWAHLRRVVRA